MKEKKSKVAHNWIIFITKLIQLNVNALNLQQISRGGPPDTPSTPPLFDVSGSAYVQIQIFRQNWP